MRRLAPFALLAFAACTGLDPKLLYKCEADRSCEQAGFVCLDDGYCHGPGDIDAGHDGGVDSGTDAGAADSGTDGGADGGVDGGQADGGDAGMIDAGCTPLVACPMGVECGFLDAGCGTELDCGGCTAPLECGTDVPLVCGRPRLCTQDHWCFENPLPQGFTIHGGWAANARHVYWVGDNQLVLFYDGKRHSVMPMPAQLDGGVDLLAVDGTSPSDVYAVGTRGTIVHLGSDGGWALEQGHNDFFAFQSVLALGDGGAIVGGNNILLRRDATGQWLFGTLPASVDGVYSALAQADGGIFALVDPGGWLVQEVPTGSNNWQVIDDAGVLDSARSMWGEPNGSLVVAGVHADAGVVLRRSPNGTWVDLLPPRPPINVVRGFGNKLYAAGAGGTLTDVGGMATYSAPEGNWNAMVPLANEVLVQGDDGRFARFDVATADFALHSAGSAITLNAICGDDSTAPPFAVSAGPGCVGTTCSARVLYRDLDGGPYWSSEDVSMPDTGEFNACTTSNGIAYLVGDGTHYLQRLSNVPLETLFDLPGGAGPYRGVWTGVNTYFVNRAFSPQGPYVTIASGPAVSPTYLQVPYDGGGDLLTAVGGTFELGLLVGEHGLALGVQPDGGLTEPFRLGMDDLTAVSGAFLDDAGAVVVAVGKAGAVFRDEGAMSFVAEPVGAADLACVSATTAGDLWAAGARQSSGNSVAAIFRRAPAGSWVQRSLNLNQPVRALWAAAADGGTTVWVGAQNGLILRQDN